LDLKKSKSKALSEGLEAVLLDCPESADGSARASPGMRGAVMTG
jgi:hypothetical protein